MLELVSTFVARSMIKAKKEKSNAQRQAKELALSAICERPQRARSADPETREG
jgi:hypothetical protein